ncbi:MAG: 4-hydroxythreonine-4-phosphate dehydrogenase PdxA [Nitrospirota bacterium]|nr:4-hydroxythreonine-4-phosphate dehydrogenase PdxA [Nitrospirota bacterium]
MSDTKKPARAKAKKSAPEAPKKAPAAKDTANLPCIAITMGDPAGIGPEIAAWALAAPGVMKSFRPVVIGPTGLLRQEMERAGADFPVREVSLDAPFEGVAPGEVAAIDPGHGIALPTPGAASADAGRIAMAAIDAALELTEAGHVAGMVTGPISKAAVQMAGNPRFTGHTEYLGVRCGHVPVRMMMTCPELTVTLVTTHMPLAEVPIWISAESVFDTLRMTDGALAMRMGISNPRIAVCGLNPHPGEFGGEDEQHIVPAIKKAQAAGLNVEGPFSADILFARLVRDQSYHAVVAMYHDQGLIPLKVLGLERAVNVTLGLPFVRTSPAHGTAYSIAGKGKADPSSMIAALRTAIKWTTPRTP